MYWVGGPLKTPAIGLSGLRIMGSSIGKARTLLEFGPGRSDAHQTSGYFLGRPKRFYGRSSGRAITPQGSLGTKYLVPSAGFPV